jgi:hypothetical protein
LHNLGEEKIDWIDLYVKTPALPAQRGIQSKCGKNHP